MKLYVWEDVLEDYTSGMICILAKNEKQAMEELYKKDDIAWSKIMGLWDRISWGSKPIKKLEKTNPNTNLCALQKIYADKEKIKQFQIRPRIIKEPEVFVVWGGG